MHLIKKLNKRRMAASFAPTAVKAFSWSCRFRASGVLGKDCAEELSGTVEIFLDKGEGDINNWSDHMMIR